MGLYSLSIHRAARLNGPEVLKEVEELTGDYHRILDGYGMELEISGNSDVKCACGTA